MCPAQSSRATVAATTRRATDLRLAHRLLDRLATERPASVRLVVRVIRSILPRK